MSAENFSVFSARAALSHAAALAEEMTAGLPHPAQQAEAFLLHLDDPHYELLLAMQAREPIGMIGILAAGDLGRIDAPFVRTARRDHGVAELLLGRAIELCARSRFADVLTSGDANQEIFLAAGFRPIGQLTIHQTRSE